MECTRVIRPIVSSLLLLRQPSETAGPEDAHIGQDLLDTLAAHAHECVGMAANMIGERKRIIVVQDGEQPLLMYNPEIILQSQQYQAEEGCLSLRGTRAAVRFRHIRVRYLDRTFHLKVQNYAGFIAQIIQHEIDHCDGIVI